MILYRPAFIIGGWDCVGYSNPSCPHGWPADYCGVLCPSVSQQAWGKSSISACRCGNSCTRLQTYINDLVTTDISSWHLAQRQWFDLNSRGIISNFVQDTGEVIQVTSDSLQSFGTVTLHFFLIIFIFVPHFLQEMTNSVNSGQN
jgi:hypothetical protein